jgi:predicted flap endonuclease-1-like 5' DNA nuclease
MTGRILLFMADLNKESITDLITILLMLLGSFAMGYLFRHFLNAGFRSQLHDAEHKRHQLLQEIETLKENQGTVVSSQVYEDKLHVANRSKELLQQDLERCHIERSKLAAELQQTKIQLKEQLESTEGVTIVREPEILQKPASIKLDPLRKIEGIGPKIESILHKHGILTFDILAKADVNKLREIVHGANPAYKVHDPETWPNQAELARDEQWEALAELQAKLKGGKLA